MKTFKDYLNENRVSEAYTSKTGKIVPKNLEELKKLVRLKKTNLANIDISGFTDLTNLFYGSKRTDFSGIENWDVSHIHNMRGMFRDCSTFTGKEIENWDVSNVMLTSDMFTNCENFDADLSKWKLNKADSLSSMFMNCESFTGKGLDKWNVSKVTNMSLMFTECSKLNADLSKWDLRNVTEIKGIFYLTKIKIPENFLKKFKELGLDSKGE